MGVKNYKFDSPLFIVVLILLTVGVVMVYSASSFKALESHNDSHHFLKAHLIKVLFGFTVMLIISRIDYRFWLKISPGLLIFSVCALLFLLISPTVPEIRGSKRWLILSGFQIQPSDFAKLALIIFLSSSLIKSRKWATNSRRNFLMHLLAIGAVVVPITLQPDIGTSVLIACVAILLLFVAGEKLRYLVGLGLAAVPLLILFISEGYQKNRIINFIASVKGEPVAWQMQQSLIALGNGSFLGLGLGGSKQKYHFLPDPFTDFVYAIVGEELGLIGTTVILILLVVFIWSGFRIAVMAPDAQGRLLAIGIVASIGIYAFANAGVVVNLLPTTGIPMPFLSYGGSAMLVNLSGVGILLNILSQIRENRKWQPAKNQHQIGNRRRHG